MGRLVLIDTSVFVAAERGLNAPLEEAGQAAISAVTIAELETGVLTAPDDKSRAARLSTLTRAMTLAAPLPIDGLVASAFARIAAKRISANERVDTNDAWIAATALVHGAEVWTFDRDLERFEDVEVRVLPTA